MLKRIVSGTTAIVIALTMSGATVFAEDIIQNGMSLYSVPQGIPIKLFKYKEHVKK